MAFREEILKRLRSAGNFVSGEELSEQLQVSRTAVWKCIGVLRREGYEIESVTNRGYRLVSCPDRLTEEEITANLGTRFLGKSVFCSASIDSTNEEAKRRALGGAPDGSIFVSEQQTGGKGRLGRNWASPAGTGIWMSVLLRPGHIPQNAPLTTLLAGLAVCRAVRNLTGAAAEIKWPNDIVTGGRKICGILTEMSAEIDRIEFLVVGIGVNVNLPEFPPELSGKATSLLRESGKTVRRVPLLQEILRQFESLLTESLTAPEPEFWKEYKSLCVSLNRTVSFTRNGKEVSGTAADISPSGELLVRLPDGKLETVFSGEVSVQGIYGN